MAEKCAPRLCVCLYIVYAHNHKDEGLEKENDLLKDVN